jgi:hypothetical protein
MVQVSVVVDGYVTPQLQQLDTQDPMEHCGDNEAVRDRVEEVGE